MAAQALTRFDERARATGTPPALGLLTRSAAPLAAQDRARETDEEALALLHPTGAGPQVARTHLLYGEWLRRQRRRREARDQLRTAHDLFEALRLDAFAERARVELRATGEHAQGRQPGHPEMLTPQEARIATLVSRGQANRDIATQLFISPSTVEYHLHKVFRKLGVTSRTQLARRVLDPWRRAGDPRVAVRRCRPHPLKHTIIKPSVGLGPRDRGAREELCEPASTSSRTTSSSRRPTAPSTTRPGRDAGIEAMPTAPAGRRCTPQHHRRPRPDAPAARPCSRRRHLRDGEPELGRARRMVELGRFSQPRSTPTATAGAPVRHPLLGWSYVAWQKLWRLAGADHMHVNGLGNKFSEADESVIASPAPA